MTEYSEVFVAFDTSKTKHAVAVAESGRDGEIRYLGEIESGPEEYDYRPGYYAVFFYDPDGIKLEILYVP